MKKIISTYKINDQTLALLPAKQMDYDTIAIEINEEKQVQKTSFQIIEEACLNDYCTYDGKREAIIHHMNFQQRTPIHVSPIKRLYFFPTHSPSNINNIWIAALQITEIEGLPRHTRTNEAQSIVI